MGAGISPMGMNMPQQPQQGGGLFSGKGGGGANVAQNLAVRDQMANAYRNSALAQQPMGGFGPQPAQPMRSVDMSFVQPAQPQNPMSIDDFARSGLMGPTTQEARNPIEFEGSMRDPRLVSAYQQYVGGGQQPTTQGPMGMQGDAFRAQQMMQQRQMPFQMQQRQMPFQMQQQMNNPMFGGLGALMAMRGFGGGFGQPMGGGFGQPMGGGFSGGFGQPMGGGFGGFGGGFGQPMGGFGGGFGQPMGGKGGGGFNQPQMGNPFGAAMSRGLGGLGFFR